MKKKFEKGTQKITRELPVFEFGEIDKGINVREQLMVCLNGFFSIHISACVNTYKIGKYFNIHNEIMRLIFSRLWYLLGRFKVWKYVWSNFFFRYLKIWLSKIRNNSMMFHIVPCWFPNIMMYKKVWYIVKLTWNVCTRIKLDCIYHFPIDFESNRIPIGFKSIGKG